MRPSSAERARERIIGFFDSLDQRVFTFSQVTNILHEQRGRWDLAKSMTTTKFIYFLIDRGKLTVHDFHFPTQPITLLFWENPPLYEVAMLIRPNGYLSHITAAEFHHLINSGMEKMICINVEQTPKPRSRTNL